MNKKIRYGYAHMRMMRMTGRTKEVAKNPTWKPVRL